jgi:hypothetical protein
MRNNLQLLKYNSISTLVFIYTSNQIHSKNFFSEGMFNNLPPKHISEKQKSRDGRSHSH